MGSLGCPLCCSQVFATVSALHEHLLYYMYRPVLCVMCRITTSGIHDLMHHLEHHIADNVPLAGSTVRPAKKVIANETKNPDVAASVSSKTSFTTSSKGTAEIFFSSTAAVTSQPSLSDKQRSGGYKKREEPAEHSLYTYFCNICGEKVIGKDMHFMHIKKHNGSLDKPHISNALQDCSDQLPPVSSQFDARGDDTALSGAHKSTPTLTPSDSTSLKHPLVSDSDTAFIDISTSIANYMDDLGSSNQLLKLREWQFEKLGKSYETRRGRILNLQGESNVGSILSQSSCSPSVSEWEASQASQGSTALFSSLPESSQAEMMYNDSPTDISFISTQANVLRSPLCTSAALPPSTSTNSPSGSSAVLPNVPTLTPRTTSSDPFGVSVSPLLSSAIPISSPYVSQSVTQHTKGFHISSNSSNIISSSLSLSSSQPYSLANIHTNLTTPQSMSPSFTSTSQLLSPLTSQTSSLSSQPIHHPPGQFFYPPSTTQSSPTVRQSFIPPHDPPVTPPSTQSFLSSSLQPASLTTTQETHLLTPSTYRSSSSQLVNLLHANDSQSLQSSGSSPNVASATQTLIPFITQSCMLPTAQPFIPATQSFTPAIQQFITTPTTQPFIPPTTQSFTPPNTQPFTLQATEPSTPITKPLTPTTTQSCMLSTSHQALSSELFTSPSSQPFTPPITQHFTPPNTQPFTPPITQPFTPPNTQPFTPPTTQPFTPPSTQPFTPPNTQPFTPSSNQSFSKIVTKQSTPTTQPSTPGTQPFTSPSAKHLTSSSNQSFISPSTQIFSPPTSQAFTPATQLFTSVAQPFIPPNTHSLTASSNQPNNLPVTQSFTPPLTQSNFLPVTEPSSSAVIRLLNSTTQSFSLSPSQSCTLSSQTVVPFASQSLRPTNELLHSYDSTLTNPLNMQPCMPPSTQSFTTSDTQIIIPPTTQPLKSNQPFTSAKEGAQDTIVPIHQAVKSSDNLHKQDPSPSHRPVFTVSDGSSVTATVPSHISSVIHAKPHTDFTHNLASMKGNESTSNMIRFLQQAIQNTSKMVDTTTTRTLATYSVTEATTSITYTSNTTQLQVKAVHVNPQQENNQKSLLKVSLTPSSIVSSPLQSGCRPEITENNVKSTNSHMVHEEPGHTVLPSSSMTNLLTLSVASPEETVENFTSSHLVEAGDTIMEANSSGALQPQGSKTVPDVQNTTPTYHTLKPAAGQANDTPSTDNKCSSTDDSTYGDRIGSLLNDEKPNALVESQGTKPYLHKKFHHEQGRRMTENTVNLAPKGNVKLYINSFQSMLVNKLNKGMGADFAVDVKDDSQSLRSDNESVLNIPPVTRTLQFICSVCKAQFRMRKDYVIHQRKHINETQVTHKCQHCDKVFNKKRSKDLHERKHTQLKTHQCSKCNKIFVKVKSFHRHLIEVHATKKSYLCSVCNKAFSTPRLLKNHVGVHRIEKTYKCKYCYHSCLTASGLRSHLHDIHSNKAPQVFKCSVCNETFKKRYGLQRHIKRRHSNEKIVCQECDKVFSCQEDLVRHKQSHSVQHCQECGKEFSSTWTLQRHAASHNPKESFQCKQCKATFTRKDSLATHMKIHAQQKEYKCHCGKRFVKKSQMTAHQDKHSEIPKYGCSECHHRFKFKISLKNHSCKPVTDK